ncbi:3-deoxy-manno-octulosonate cytidylyltransferase [Cobetia amphilecti]|uniref:3-deoxy-manno-octulosonate cytidylyltransferase n=1 Tax=Cobetia amphilecti TaxID=1055104 RepID=UPI000A813B62|nr:3-deoxy-manno-octulosonate cytidylyltransferase [Cobetia amphilecti]
MTIEMNQKTVIIIPARYGSSRLPGKPLADIAGKPMVQHVVERATQVSGIDAVWVATDDERVFDAVEAFGGHAVMTSPEHASGTDRLVEVMQKVSADIYLNVQGDEPLVRPGDLELLVASMQNSQAKVGTLCHAISSEEAKNPNTVKVLCDQFDDALYFSRSPIPYPREVEEASYRKHVGVYVYRREVLEGYSRLPQSMAERAESLEQLRLMHAGIKIHVIEVEETGPGVDTPQCLETVRALIEGRTPQSKPDPLAQTRLLITDVDGVLTDGGIYYDASGESLKQFHVRDGLGIRLLEESGIQVAVLSGRDSATLRKRISDLGISHAKLGVKDKHAACQELMATAGATAEQTVFIGDDVIDLPAFEACGRAYAVADAPDYIKAQADEVLLLPGGKGAVRELADRILLAQGREAVYSTASGFLDNVAKVAQ